MFFKHKSTKSLNQRVISRSSKSQLRLGPFQKLNHHTGLGGSRLDSAGLALSLAVKAIKQH